MKIPSLASLNHSIFWEFSWAWLKKGENRIKMAIKKELALELKD
jgi:hypothetical protein